MNAKDIEQEYDRLGHRLGWTFMLCPEARLSAAAVAIVGFNPGGDEDGGGQWDCPTGNVFYTQRWAAGGTAYSSVQKEVHAWHDCLGLGPDETFLAELIPFRSRSEAELPRYVEGLAFGQRLWRWTLGETSARAFLCMGMRVTWEIATLLGATKAATFPTGWGKRVIELWIAPDGRRVIGLPHPSRYTLFHRRDPAHVAIATDSLRAAIAV